MTNEEIGEVSKLFVVVISLLSFNGKQMKPDRFGLSQQ